MKLLSSRRLALVAILAATGAIGSGALLFVSALGDEQPDVVSLAGIDMQELIDDSGLVFTAPGDETAVITAKQAEEILDEGHDVREVVLAHLNAEGPPSIDSLVWVVDYDPLTVPPMTANADYLLYYIGVVDARSGEFLFYQGSADSCSRTGLFPQYKDVTGPICSGDVRFE